MKYAVVFEKTDTGYSAHIPDLPGCVAAGTDLQETQQLIREAVEMHLEGIREDGDSIPQPTTITDYVTVPQDIAG
jgi:predicted RNase H-like HicB family nuclease